LNIINENINKNELINILCCLKNKHFKRTSIVILVNDIWKLAKFKSNVATNEIQGYLNDYKRSFKRNADKLKKECYKKFNTHKREKLYPDKEKFLKNCVDGKDNLKKLGNDMNIILDAHDLSYKSNIKIIKYLIINLNLI
jgi:hypothetical protein